MPIVEDRVIAYVARGVAGEGATDGELAFRKGVDALQTMGVAVTAQVARALRDDIALLAAPVEAPAPLRAANANRPGVRSSAVAV